MEKLHHVLAIIFYLIWIPLGILIGIVVIYLVLTNPLKTLTQGLGTLGGGAPSPASFFGGSGGFPTPPTSTSNPSR